MTVLALSWFSALGSAGDEPACGTGVRGSLGAPADPSAAEPATHPPGAALDKTGDPGADSPEPARRGLTTEGV